MVPLFLQWQRGRMMETIEYFEDFLRKIGAINFLAIGIVVMLLWLLISGIRRGMKRGNKSREPEENGKDPS